jgi:hypothetical protein
VIRALVIVGLLAPTARADDAVDANAEHQANEANLESQAPRQGVTITVALGGGLLLGDGASDEITALTLRLGHVATAHDIIDLELTSGTYLRALANEKLTDSSTTLSVGDQHYVAPAFWVRIAGGLNVHTMDNGPMGTTTHLGPAGALGFGVDLVREHFFVLGLEWFTIGSLESGGLIFTGVLGLDLSRY